MGNGKKRCPARSWRANTPPKKPLFAKLAATLVLTAVWMTCVVAKGADCVIKDMEDGMKLVDT